MSRVLIVVLSAAATLYALRSREALPLSAALWEREARLRALERERDGLLRAALRGQRAETVARIAGRLPRTHHFALEPGEGVILPAGRLRLASLSEAWGTAALEYQTEPGE